MKTSSAQLLKEARQLAWPWAAVTVPGLAILANPWLSASPTAGTWHFTDWILGAGAFLGSLLLAALPLGAEFQFRTLGMRLAQPIQRRALWRQKFLVTMAAMAPPAAIYCLAIAIRYGRPAAIMAAAWIAVILAGGIPFTLLTRSTMGSVVLNNSGGFLVTYAWMHYEKHGHLPLGGPWALGMALATYVAVAIWLGRRMLLRFQAVDGMQAGEAFVPGARLMPRFVAGWFRCRPTQPLFNLVRREFRLMRVLWPLSLLYLVAWVLLVIFRQLPPERTDSRLVAFAFTIILGVLIAVLAGTLSLGEEKTWGTHEWHMTLPMPVSLQWAVKFLFAVFTSVVCTALLPMAVLLAGRWLGLPTQLFLTRQAAAGWMAEAAAITLVAFWCACVVRGTVQATIWVFPLFLGIFIAGEAGPWALGLVAHPFRSVVATVISQVDAIALERVTSRIIAVFDFGNTLAIAGALLLAVGLIQSHRLFRAQDGANRLRVVRCALPLVTVAFLCGLAGNVLMVVFTESWRQQATILRETDSAIAAAQAQLPPADPGRPRRLSFQELADASRLSAGTQRWLRHASITVVPAPHRLATGPGLYIPGRKLFLVPSSQLRDRVPYSAVVHTAQGRDCSLLFQIQRQGPVGFLTAVCD